MAHAGDGPCTQSQRRMHVRGCDGEARRDFGRTELYPNICEKTRIKLGISRFELHPLYILPDADHGILGWTNRRFGEPPTFRV